jgi:hypothetical protein
VTWSAGTPAATKFELYLGTTKGASDIYRGGIILAPALTTTVGSIPANGVFVYATLWQEQSGKWISTSAEFKESGAPTPGVIAQPTDGSILGTTNVQFAWPTGTAGPTDFSLSLGTGGYGTSDIFKGATRTTSITVPTIPNDGVTVYALFEQEINGVWQSSEFQYTESGTEMPGAIAAPLAPGPLAGASQQFRWSLGTGVTAYELRVGRVSGVCSWDIYSSGVLSATTASNTATGLPTDGSMVYVCLVQRIDDSWTSTAQYTYTAF